MNISQKFAAIWLSTILTGCASQIMSGYLGEPVQMAMLDYGPPLNAFDLPDGTRAFQWVLTHTYVTPTTISQSGNVRATAGNANWISKTKISGGQPISTTCAYTMLARWDEDRTAWIFYDFRKPRFGCE